MNKNIQYFIILLLLTSLAILTNASSNINGFIAHTITSQYLKEQRKIYVKLPKDYQSSGKEKYTVIYVLGSRKLTMKVIQDTKALQQKGQMPKVIVVGIPHKNTQTRKRDLTPNFLKQDLKVENSATGQASNFLKFLDKEVLTLIEQKYPTDKRSVLVGHSREGLFTMYALMQKHQVFDGYIALSPALWREKSLFVAKFKTFIQQKPSLPASLFMSMGTKEVKKMTKAFDQLTGVLKQHKIDGFEWKSSYTPDANHQTNHLQSVAKGLLRFFQNK